MNELIPLQNTPTMSSRGIATLCDKRHDNVMADIDNLNETYEKWGCPKLGKGITPRPTQVISNIANTY